MPMAMMAPAPGAVDPEVVIPRRCRWRSGSNGCSTALRRSACDQVGGSGSKASCVTIRMLAGTWLMAASSPNKGSVPSVGSSRSRKARSGR